MCYANKRKVFVVRRQPQNSGTINVFFTRPKSMVTYQVRIQELAKVVPALKVKNCWHSEVNRLWWGLAPT